MSNDPEFTHASDDSGDELLDQVCDDYETVLKAGGNPQIENYLDRVAAPRRATLFRNLLALDLSYCKKRGKEPTPQSYYERFPNYRDAVDCAFEDAVGDDTSDVRSEPEPEPEPPDISVAFPEGSRWKILEEVGAGAMGVVYRAFDKKLKIQVAIKLLLPGYSRSRFVREAHALAKIHCDYVVGIFDFELLTGGYPILVMQWIDGIDLAKTIKGAGGPLPEDRALRWMQQTCEGMLAAADQRIIHRDLKPSSILIDRSDKVHVVDFGLARDLTAGEGSGSTRIVGTAWYMSPEQAEDPNRVETRADIYSFGATFYHVLTGEPPFAGPSVFSILLKHRSEPLVPPIARNPKISQRISDLLERCLAKSPAERFQTFGQVLSELVRPEDVPPWPPSEDAELLPHLLLYRQRRDAYLDGRAPFRRTDTYDFSGDRRLSIMDGDIVDQDVDAIVSSSDGQLSMDFGVSRAICSAGGDGILDEARRYAPVRPGHAVVTSAGNLKARFIFHGITSGFSKDKKVPQNRDIIPRILESCFHHAEALDIQSIAFPLLGTGAMGFPRDVCLDIMFRYLARRLLQGVTPVKDVRIVLFPNSE